MRRTPFVLPAVLVLVTACGSPAPAPAPDAEPEPDPVPTPDFTLPADNTHNRWSATIAPVLTVPSGAVVEIFTKEASDGQITLETTAADLASVDFGLIHALTGPIAVEGAEPGDLLAVTIHEAEVQGPGWSGIFPGFGFLADEFTGPWLRSFDLEPGATEARFNDRITLPLAPFPGVLGVAPATDEMLVTIPPRENGGNMDNRHMRPGATVYIPVQVPGANFSIGDTHAVQGDGEVSGSAIEAPMRLVVTLEVLPNPRGITEPEYETDEYYAVTGFDPDIDEAAKKATRHMIAWLVAEHGLTREEAYVLCSLARGPQDLRDRGRPQHAGEHAHAEIHLLREAPPMKNPAIAIVAAAALTALPVRPAAAQGHEYPDPFPGGYPSAADASNAGRMYMESYFPPPVTASPTYPAWSPDGASIAFAYQGRIWVVPRRGRHGAPGHERPRLPLPAELVSRRRPARLRGRRGPQLRHLRHRTRDRRVAPPHHPPLPRPAAALVAGRVPHPLHHGARRRLRPLGPRPGDRRGRSRHRRPGGQRHGRRLDRRHRRHRVRLPAGRGRARLRAPSGGTAPRPGRWNSSSASRRTTRRRRSSPRTEASSPT